MGGGYICSIGAVASRDGQDILTASAAVVRIYSSATAALVFELKGHTGDVTALALSPHGSRKVFHYHVLMVEPPHLLIAVEVTRARSCHCSGRQSGVSAVSHANIKS